jgi:hypothetical protein
LAGVVASRGGAPIKAIVPSAGLGAVLDIRLQGSIQFRVFTHAVTVAADIVGGLEEPQAAGQLTRRLAVLTHPSLLEVDEIGYLPINHAGAVLFFQLMNRRYEKASTLRWAHPGSVRRTSRSPRLSAAGVCPTAL